MEVNEITSAQICNPKKTIFRNCDSSKIEVNEIETLKICNPEKQPFEIAMHQKSISSSIYSSFV